jgi:Ni2+-binding GTPase involved in maturation of urease and hydrogenase
MTNEVKITVSGAVGSGKSAILQTIARALAGKGVEFEFQNWDEAFQEQQLTDADQALKELKPKVILVEDHVGAA